MAARKGMSGVVRRICLWCQGKSWMRVRECAQVSCPLHACRLEEDGNDAELQECIRNFCLVCAGDAESVRECSADRPMGGQPACPAHPYRDAEAFAVCAQPLVSQQVRPLPGLGDVCAAPRETSAPLRADVPTPLCEQPRTVPVAMPQAGPDALSISHVERVPEALDI